ncbi:MAG: metal-sensitive transcriptional regulator, partial [Candidatus Moranbacteria bacterium]|nr:metal-sensitive transcriptional regulator [Candidatus Moranbacteria bacterium]
MEERSKKKKATVKKIGAETRRVSSRAESPDRVLRRISRIEGQLRGIR